MWLSPGQSVATNVVQMMGYIVILSDGSMAQLYGGGSVIRNNFLTKPYLALVGFILTVWVSYMLVSDSWWILAENIPIMVTMVLGSFVAGVSAEGGGAVAFPVFTKVLHIDAVDARNFGLLIQSVGMGAATFYIYTNRFKVLWKVIAMVTIGGVFGQLFGAYVLHLSGTTAKILFTIISTMLGIALFLMRWVLKLSTRETLPGWNLRYRALFLTIGFVGGCFASQTSSGIDMLCFIFLVVLFGVNEKIATLSSVVIMAFNSMAGALIHTALIQDVTPFSYHAWLSAIPIVIFGAPLGSFVTTRIHRDAVIVLLMVLILTEFISTLILIPIDPVLGASVTLSAVVFFGLLLYFRMNR